MSKTVSTILLVDDDLAINFFHKRLFTKLALGETIVSLYNGAEAIRDVQNLNNSLNEKDLVLIFLDINMPIIDGWEFLEGFKNIFGQLNYQYKIFVLSSSMNPDDIEKAKKNNFVSDYFSKPLTVDTISSLREQYL